MPNKFDFTFIGLGKVAETFLSRFPKEKVLVVTNQESYRQSDSNFVKFSTYADLIGTSRDLITNHIILTLQPYNVDNQDIKSNLINSIVLNSKFGRITFLSSVAVYPSSKIPSTEDQLTVNNSDYAYLKLMNEKHLVQIVPKDKLQILRISNIYGTPGVSRFFDKYASVRLSQEDFRLPLNVHMRDFVHIDDLIDYLSQAAETSCVPLLNFASGLSMNLKTCVESLDLFYKNDTKVIFDLPDSQPLLSKIDIKRLNDLLGKSPKQFDPKFVAI